MVLNQTDKTVNHPKHGKVLWVVPVSNIGGVARHVTDALTHGIPDWDVELAGPPGPLMDAIKMKTSVAVHEIEFGPDYGTLKSVKSLRRVLKSENYQIVHSHLAYADIATFLATRAFRNSDGSRLKLVTTEHGIAADSKLYNARAISASLKKLVHRIRLSRTDRLIAVSNSTAQQVRKQWSKTVPITVTKNGVDPKPFRKTERGYKFLSLSRLSHEKRVDQALKAFALVVKEQPSATFTIAGDGPELENLKALANDLGVADKVSFPGFVDSEEALQTHDVIVQLSAWENLSYTLLDAVAYGLGVVATDVGGNSEIVGSMELINTPEDSESVASAYLKSAGSITETNCHDYFSSTISAMTNGISETYIGVYK